MTKSTRPRPGPRTRPGARVADPLERAIPPLPAYRATGNGDEVALPLDALRAAQLDAFGAGAEYMVADLRANKLLGSDARASAPTPRPPSVTLDDAQARIVELAATAAARAIAGNAPDVQRIEIVGLPPMAAEVIRDPKGRIAGIVDA